MALRLTKSRAGLLAETRLPSSREPFYIRVYLWATQEAYEREGREGSVACFRSHPYQLDKQSDTRHTFSPCLGELHFCARRWDDEVAAHEVQHALLHRIEAIGPHWRRIEDMEGEERQEGDADGRLVSRSNEEVCTEAGKWVAAVHEFLWQHDPNPNWRKEGAAHA